MEETRKLGDHFLPDLWRADYAGGLDQLLVICCRVGTDYRLATAGSWAAAMLFCFCDPISYLCLAALICILKKVWSEFVPFVACLGSYRRLYHGCHDCHGRRNGNQTGFYLQDCSVGYFSGTELHLQQVVYF